MLDKLKILVPLDISDIRGAANEGKIDSHYKHVFEEALSLAKSLNAEIILLHILNRREEESLLQDGAPESDRFYSPADLVDLNALRETSHFPIARGEAFTEREFDAWKVWRVPLDYNDQHSIQLLVARARDEGVQAQAMNMIDSRSLLICEVATTWDADLIVMGRGKGAEWRCLRLDSVSTYVLHHAPCSIVLVDPQTRDITNLRQILVAVDFSASSQEIFRQALSLAVRVRTAAIAINPKTPPEAVTPTITLLHVGSYFDQYDYPEARGSVALSWDFGIPYDDAVETAAQAIERVKQTKQTWVRSLKAQAEEHHIPVQYLERLAEESEPQGISRFVPQPDALPGQTICDVAAELNADLIVLGYRREWELKKLLLGSVCNYVTHYSTSPVMIARNFKPRLSEGAIALEKAATKPPEPVAKSTLAT
jgi:nucleotide-binding universal stress UspA family protein